MKNKKRILILAILFTFTIGFIYAKPTRFFAGNAHHSAIYDSANKQMLIWGGKDQLGSFSDLGVYDIEKQTWNKIKIDESPPDRVYYSIIYDSGNKQIIIFGGSTNQGEVLSDLWTYDIEKKTWKEIETDKEPPARTHHSAIYDSANKQMLIWGGTSQSGAFSDLWAYGIEKKKWEEIETDDVPPARTHHSTIYDSTNKQMLIFGGTSQGEVLSDLWTYDIEKKTWKEIETDEPLFRSGYSAIYDYANKQMLIFGGIDQLGVLSDLWAFDIEKKTWKEIETDKEPLARCDHSAIYDPINKQLLILGGFSRERTVLSDLWSYDIEKKTWQKLKTKLDKD